MPTHRPRHTITESDELAHALDDAARHWPEDRGSRSRLLLRLVHRGHRTLHDEAAAEEQRRRDAVRATAGALTGAYPAGYLDELRADWPA